MVEGSVCNGDSFPPMMAKNSHKSDTGMEEGARRRYGERGRVRSSHPSNAVQQNVHFELIARGKQTKY
jgi:hypothetical protein